MKGISTRSADAKLITGTSGKVGSIVAVASFAPLTLPEAFSTREIDQVAHAVSDSISLPTAAHQGMIQIARPAYMYSPIKGDYFDRRLFVTNFFGNINSISGDRHS